MACAIGTVIERSPYLTGIVRQASSRIPISYFFAAPDTLEPGLRLSLTIRRLSAIPKLRRPLFLFDPRGRNVAMFVTAHMFRGPAASPEQLTSQPRILVFELCPPTPESLQRHPERLAVFPLRQRAARPAPDIRPPERLKFIAFCLVHSRQQHLLHHRHRREKKTETAAKPPSVRSLSAYFLLTLSLLSHADTFHSAH